MTQPVGDPAPIRAGDEAEGPVPVCRKLRTKLAFSAMVTPAGAPLQWRRGEGSTAVYWCLVTMECAGPDNALVHATECRAGRACYRAAESAADSVID